MILDKLFKRRKDYTKKEWDKLSTKEKNEVINLEYEMDEDVHERQPISEEEYYSMIQWYISQSRVEEKKIVDGMKKENK